MASMDALSESAEMMIKNINELAADDKRVRTSDLATKTELKPLQKLLLVSKEGKLTDNGAQLLEKLHLFDQSFVSKKTDFTDRTAAFDALFEDL